MQTVQSYQNGSQVSSGAYSYDGDGRLTALGYKHADNSDITTTGGQAVGYALEYDAAANITQVVSADGTDNYGIDPADQLKTASLTSENYSYDQNGNRTGAGYQTGGDNRLLSDSTFTYQYDKDGNRTVRTRKVCTGWWIFDNVTL